MHAPQHTRRTPTWAVRTLAASTPAALLTLALALTPAASAATDSTARTSLAGAHIDVSGARAVGPGAGGVRPATEPALTGVALDVAPAQLGTIATALPTSDLGLSTAQLKSLLESLPALKSISTLQKLALSTLLGALPGTTPLSGLLDKVLGALGVDVAPAELLEALKTSAGDSAEVARTLGTLAGGLQPEQLTALRGILAGAGGELSGEAAEHLRDTLTTLLGEVGIGKLTTVLGALEGSLSGTQLSQVQTLLGTAGSLSPGELKTKLGEALDGLQAEQLGTLGGDLYGALSPAQVQGVTQELLAGLPFAHETAGELAGGLGVSLESLATQTGVKPEELSGDVATLTAPLVKTGKKLSVLSGVEGLALGLIGDSVSGGSESGGSGPGGLGSGGSGSGGSGSGGSGSGESGSGLGSGSGSEGGGLGSGGSGSGSGGSGGGSEGGGSGSELGGSGKSGGSGSQPKSGGSGNDGSGTGAGSDGESTNGDVNGGGSGAPGGAGGSGATGTALLVANAAPVLRQAAVHAAAMRRRSAVEVLTHRLRGDVATLVVRVPAAGRLTVRGGGARVVSRRVPRAGRVTLRVWLTRAASAAVHRRHGRLRVTLHVVFAPAHGVSSAAATTTVRLA